MRAFSDVVDLAGAEAGVPDGWGQGKVIFGGLTAGWALKAAATHAEGRPLRSAMVQFAGPPGAAMAVSSRLGRRGRSITAVSAEVATDRGLVVSVAAMYGDARDTKISLPGKRSPQTPAPETLMELQYIEGITPVFSQNFEYRWPTMRLPFSGSDVANVGGWVRHRRGAPVDVVGVLALIDAWPPPVLSLLTAPRPAVTLTWQVNVVGELPEGGVPVDEFWRFESNAVASSGGFADVESYLWAPDGSLFATSRQLVAEYS